MSSRRLPALRDLLDDLRPLLPDVAPPPLPAVPQRPLVTYVPPVPAPRAWTPDVAVQPGAILDAFYAHVTTLGRPDPVVLEWLRVNAVPISPALTVLLMKGVSHGYRSPHGSDYTPGCLVTDPDFGRRENAGVYLSPDRQTVRTFMGWDSSYHLMVVEVAVSDLSLCLFDHRKIRARQVYVHREIPR
jgi:hypothetical protein